MTISTTRKRGNLTPEKFLNQKKTRKCTNPDCEQTIEYTFRQIKDGEVITCNYCGTEITITLK